MKKTKLDNSKNHSRFVVQKITTRKSEFCVLMDEEKTVPCYYATLYWQAKLKHKAAGTQYHRLYGIKEYYDFFLHRHGIPFENWLKDSNHVIDTDKVIELNEFFDWLVERKNKNHTAARTYRKFFAVVSFFEYLIARYFDKCNASILDEIEHLRSFYYKKSLRNKTLVNNLMFQGMFGQINKANTLITDDEFKDFIDKCGELLTDLTDQLGLED